MTPPTPHPLRCDHGCSHLKQDNTYWKLVCTKHNFDVITQDKEEHIKNYGCASHSSAVNVEAVIAELERRKSMCYADFGGLNQIAAFEVAIALLKVK